MASKHYSGNRVAGRKPVGKRALSLLMALVMSLSLVQITAFAVDGSTKQVVNAGGVAYYDAGGTALEATGAAEPEDWAVKVKRTLAETSTENLFEVNLEVATKENTVSTDAEAAAVLVIDISGSMGWCATCGKEEDDKNHQGEPVWKCPVGDTTWDPGRWYICKNCHYSGWDHTLVNVGPNHAYQSRLELAKFAANSFVASFAQNAAGETATAPRYVAIVAFADKAITKCAWVDVTEGTTAVEAAINALGADGGTNTEAGLQLAANLLGQKNDVENRFAVLLTDGLPTFYIENHEDNSRDGLEVVPSGYYTTEQGIFWDRQEWHDGVAGKGNDTTTAETAPVETVSKALKEDDVKVYGVTYGVTEQIPNGNNVKKDIDAWMTEDCQMAGVYSVDKPNDLNTAFSDIINTIQNESVSTTVVTAVNNMTGEDDLKNLYSFVQFINQNGATEANNEVSWDLSKAVSEASTVEGEKTYQMSYQVWMHTETTGFQPGTPYSLGAAKLSFQVNEGEVQEVNFPDVSAKGYLGSFSFTKVESVGNEFAPLPGAAFQLSANAKTLSADSGENGAVAFTGIPSGYTYTLSETEAPEGYTATEKTWTVIVAYGEVTVVENTGSDGLVPVDLDSFQIVNEKVPRADASYQVVHAYFNGETLVHATDPVTVNAKEGDVVTSIQQEPVYDSVTYTFTSMDKTLPWTLAAGENGTVTLRYEYEEKIPADASYQVVHAYYENGTLVHETEPVTVNAKEGDAVTSIQQEPDYNGVTYTFTSMDKTLPWTLVAGGNGTVTLRYDRTYNPPVNPTYSYYTVTVNYFDKDSGAALRTAYSITQREGTSYDVTAQDAIAIEGYTYAETTGDALKGTLNGNKTINVYYTKDSTPVNPPVTPVDPPVDPNPVAPPETGDAMGFWIAAAAVSGLGLVWLALSSRKRREEA